MLSELEKVSVKRDQISEKVTIHTLGKTIENVLDENPSILKENRDNTLHNHSNDGEKMISGIGNSIKTNYNFCQDTSSVLFESMNNL